jgi:hypothetical protein
MLIAEAQGENLPIVSNERLFDCGRPLLITQALETARPVFASPETRAPLP